MAVICFLVYSPTASSYIGHLDVFIGNWQGNIFLRKVLHINNKERRKIKDRSKTTACQHRGVVYGKSLDTSDEGIPLDMMSSLLQIQLCMVSWHSLAPLLWADFSQNCEVGHACFPCLPASHFEHSVCLSDPLTTALLRTFSLGRLLSLQPQSPSLCYTLW